MYSSISHQLHALMLEYWARNMVGGLLIFLISHFVLFYFQKHPVKKWEWQKESLKVSKPVTLLINAEICLKIQEAKFEVYCPNQAEHGWEAIWSGVTGAIPWDCLSDFLPNILVIYLSLPFCQNPVMHISAEPYRIKGKGTWLFAPAGNGITRAGPGSVVNRFHQGCGRWREMHKLWAFANSGITKV